MDDTTLIEATDGFRLAATTFEPADKPRAWVVINAAMGVKSAYYRAFARHLASQGYAAVTWDYRGVAASRPPPPGPIALRDWAEKDMEGVLRWALAKDAPVAVVGHSLGTQILGLAASAQRLSGVLGVGSQSGDWRVWPLPHALGMLLLSTVLLPSVTGAFGKLPRGLMGEEVPKGPVSDWARWIRSKGYLLSEGAWIAERYAQVTCPMVAVSIDDDHYAPRATVDRLYAIYRNARVTRVHWKPRELGLKRIGHFGPFRSNLGATLWPQLVRALDEMVVPVRAVA